MLPEHALTPTPPASCESSAPLCSGQMCPWGGSGEVTTSGGEVVRLLGRLPAGRPAKLLHCWMFQEGHQPLLLLVSTCVIIKLWFCFFGVGEKVGTPRRCKRSGAFSILLWCFFFPLWNLKSLFLTVLLVCSFLTSGQRLGESTAVHRTTRDCRCKKCSDSPDWSDDSRVTGDSVGNPAILLITGSLR